MADPQVYDFVCAGFGPAGLALAIALAAAPAATPSPGGLPKVFSSIGGLQDALRESAVSTGQDQGAPGSSRGPRAAEAEAAEAGGGGGRQLRVAFLEKQDTFRWHDAMQLPGATMQIS